MQTELIYYSNQFFEEILITILVILYHFLKVDDLNF